MSTLSQERLSDGPEHGLPPGAPAAATLTVARAAQRLGVHPNTIRTWTDQGRLRCLRINARGDRRYRIEDLDAFIADAGRESAFRVAAAEARLETATRTARAAREAEWTRLDARPERRPASARPSDPLTLPLFPDDAVVEPRRTAVEAAPTRQASKVPTATASETTVELLADVARLIAASSDLDATLRVVARTIRERLGLVAVTIAELRDGQARFRAGDGPPVGGLRPLSVATPPIAEALQTLRPAQVEPGAAHGEGSSRPVTVDVAVPILVGDEPWGLLLAAAGTPEPLGEAELLLLGGAGDQLAAGIEQDRRLSGIRRQLHQATALRRISADISAKLDAPQILSELVDHTLVLFEADRAAVYLIRDDGTLHPAVARNLSSGYLERFVGAPAPALGAQAIAERRVIVATDYANDPRATDRRAAVVQEGFDTITLAPLFADDEPVALLALYHDQSHPWRAEELDVLDGLAIQAGIALANATNYTRMAGWAAQLQSIQSLAARLSGLLTVRDIGMAMARELDQLIDYHSIRVYRLRGDDLIPVAWRGNAGVYRDTTGEELRGKVGRGIIGWVAEHRVMQDITNAAEDPRGVHIPGTPDIEESMLVAPMLFEGDCLGVIALSKLGIGAFTADHERLLEIYASFAAQAMANADAHEQLRRKSDALEQQLHGQRELLRVTESMLTTLDPRAVLEEIAERLGSIVQVDNLSIDLHDQQARVLRPILARGIHEAKYLARPLADDQGVCGWVVQHGVGQLVPDQLADPRVEFFEDDGPVEGTLIVVPLRGRAGIAGVMTLERLGAGRAFTEDEFELVQLFAAQASIALQNAETHHEVALRAETDALTGLRNHGTFQETLGRSVVRGSHFSLLMLDLDHFKTFNDRRGHQAGNQLLKGIAKALLSAGRDADAVFRYGGDEFALILPFTDADGARAVASKVADAVRAAGRRRSGPTVSASIGIATYPADGATREELLLAADRACYAAKRGGGDRVATAVEGLWLAGEFLPTAPTPVDEGDVSA